MVPVNTMRTHRLILAAWIILCQCLLVSLAPAPAQAETALIQDEWGGIIAITRDEGGAFGEPSLSRPLIPMQSGASIVDLIAYPDGAYQLSVMGNVIPLGEVRPLPVVSKLTRPARAFAIDRQTLSGWLAVDDYLKLLGRPPQMVFPPQFHQGIAVADIEYQDNQQELFVLFENGQAVRCTGENYQLLPQPELQGQAIDLEVIPDGVMVLSASAEIWRLRGETLNPVDDAPEIEEGLVRDLEAVNAGQGYYLLDTFGMVYAGGNADPIPTEPLTVDAARDLEIVEGLAPPLLTSPSEDTRVSLQPEIVNLDPRGSPKRVSLVFDQVEKLTSFDAEIHYDPELISIDSRVEVGEWWQRSLVSPHIRSTFDAERGVLRLTGSGSFAMFEGVTGAGTAAAFLAQAATDVEPVTTTLQLENVIIHQAFPGPPQAMQDVGAATVHIRTLEPRFSVDWQQIALPGVERESSPTLRVGDVVQVNLWVENGSRIQRFEFGFSFNREALHFLGMTPGWRSRSDLAFSSEWATPTTANQQGGLSNQILTILSPQTVPDQPTRLLQLYFEIQDQQPAEFRFTQLQAFDAQAQNMQFDREMPPLRFPVQTQTAPPRLEKNPGSNS